jgi:hypothetical protein
MRRTSAFRRRLPDVQRRARSSVGRIPRIRSLAGLAAVSAIVAWSALSVVNAFGTVDRTRSASSAAYEYEYNKAHLFVVKHVVNNNGRTAVASDFTMTIGGVLADGGNSFPGSETGTMKIVQAGSYTLSETGPAGYLPTYSSGCSGTLSAGQTATCTVTNDDVAAPLELVAMCFRGRTIVVQQKFVASLLARGATLGPC